MPAPGARRPAVTDGECGYSRCQGHGISRVSWNVRVTGFPVWIGNDPPLGSTRRRQSVFDDGGVDLQPLQIAVAAEDPGAPLKAQDQAGVIADRVVSVGVVDQ